MKKKAIIILIIAGIFTLGLWIRFADDSGEVSKIENAAVEDYEIADGLNGKGRRQNVILTPKK